MRSGLKSKMDRGDWVKGQEYTKALDGRILITVEGYQSLSFIGGNKHPGVRESSDSFIEIDFYYKGQRCRERFSLKPSPANLRKAA